MRKKKTVIILRLKNVFKPRRRFYITSHIYHESKECFFKIVLNYLSVNDTLFITLLRVVSDVFLYVPTGDMSLEVFFQQELHCSLQKEHFIH